MAKTPIKAPAKAAAKPASKPAPKPAAKPAPKPKAIVPPITAPKIKKLAAKALEKPSTLTTAETQELGASVMRHIEPRKGGKP